MGAIFGLGGVILWVALNTSVIAVVGRRKYGSLRAWWRS
jgi:hypothetical protein